MMTLDDARAVAAHGARSLDLDDGDGGASGSWRRRQVSISRQDHRIMVVVEDIALRRRGYFV